MKNRVDTLKISKNAASVGCESPYAALRLQRIIHICLLTEGHCHGYASFRLKRLQMFIMNNHRIAYLFNDGDTLFFTLLFQCRVKAHGSQT